MPNDDNDPSIQVDTDELDKNLSPDDVEEVDPVVDDDLVAEDDGDFSGAIELDDEDDETDEDGPAPAAQRVVPDDDDDDEPDPDDVEEDLDTILKDRIAAGEDEDEDEDEQPVASTTALQQVEQRKENEWICEGCFLILSRTQFASSDSTYCKDCEANL